MVLVIRRYICFFNCGKSGSLFQIEPFHRTVEPGTLTHSNQVMHLCAKVVELTNLFGGYS